MIQTCVDDIINLKPSSSLYVDKLFCELYARSIIKMLLKLGVEEKDDYIFDPRKKKLRGVDKDTYGICYRIYPTKKGIFEEYSIIEHNGKYYELWEYFYTEEFMDVNTTPLHLSNMEFWDKIYNYIRMDLNSKDKSKIVIKKH